MTGLTLAIVTGILARGLSVDIELHPVPCDIEPVLIILAAIHYFVKYLGYTYPRPGLSDPLKEDFILHDHPDIKDHFVGPIILIGPGFNPFLQYFLVPI